MVNDTFDARLFAIAGEADAYRRQLEESRRKEYAATHLANAWKRVLDYLQRTNTGLSAHPDGTLTVTDQGGQVLHQQPGPHFLAKALAPELQRMYDDETRERMHRARHRMADKMTGDRLG